MYANTLETLLARQDIADCLARYARGVDRSDADMLNSCYFDDAIEEHGSSFTGNAREYVAGAMKRLAKAGVMAHYICNTHIEFDGDVAWVESYLLTFARFGTPEEPWDTLTGGRVIDRFEKRGGEWRIAHRKVAFDWNHDIKSNETWCLGMFKPDDPRMVMGTRGTGDLSYSRF
jgi:ketosteroid isomerase-like protein